MAAGTKLNFTLFMCKGTYIPLYYKKISPPPPPPPDQELRGGVGAQAGLF